MRETITQSDRLAFKQYHSYLIYNDGRIFSLKRGTFKKQSLTNDGYHYVCLIANKKSQRYLVHRLVAELFCNKPSPELEVHHIDNDRANNNASNLVWITRAENLSYKKYYFSDERRAQISEFMKQRVVTQQHRDNLRLANLGKKQSPETVAKRLATRARNQQNKTAA